MTTRSDFWPDREKVDAAKRTVLAEFPEAQIDRPREKARDDPFFMILWPQARPLVSGFTKGDVWIRAAEIVERDMG